jgi:outer membrane protein OmpA-like peptidoglycan-associated protein
LICLWLASLAWSQDADFVEAPELDAQLYRTPVDAVYTLWADDTTVAPNGYWTAKVMFDYVNGPVGASLDSDGEELVILRDALSADVVGGISYSRFRLGVDLPVYLVSTSDLNIGGAGLGDLALDLRAVALDPSGTASGVGVGISLRTQLPTATVTTPLGTAKPTIEPALIVDKHFASKGLLAMNVGYRVGPELTASNLDMNDQFVFRVGGGYAPLETVGFSADVAGRIDTRMGLDDPASAPMEAVVGGWVRPEPNGLMLRMGAGTGLTRGIGAPVYRMLFAVGWEPPHERDRDSDGFMDRNDSCPDQPEDFDEFDDADGCPDIDNDADGLVDAHDTCPNQPEDLDTWEDEDGCPDPLTQLSVVAVDADGHGIPTATVMIGSDEEEVSGTGAVVAEVIPGVVSLRATADGFESAEATFEVAEGAPAATSIRLTPEAKMGKLDLEITDAEGAVFDAFWDMKSINQGFPSDDPRQPAPGGRATASVLPDEYMASASAVGYRPALVPILIVADEVTHTQVVLRPATGVVTIRVLNLDGEPVDAVWAVEGNDIILSGDVVNGETEEELRIGDYDVTIDAPKYATLVLPVTIKLDHTEELVAVVSPERVKVTQEKIEIDGKVYFEVNSDVIKSSSFALLDEVAGVFRDHEELTKVRIEGHTDQQGAAAYNLTLSERRAASVRQYFIEAGIDANRLEAEGYGETRLIDEANSREAHAKNRRVDFVVVERSDGP